MVKLFRKHSSVVLLLLLATLALLHGLLAERAGQDDVLILVLLATLAAGAAEAAASGMIALIAGGLATLTFCAVIAARWFHMESAIQAQPVLLAIFFAFCAVRLLQKVLRPGLVNAGKLYDAASIYLLLGLTWSALYNWTEQQVPGSFRVATDTSRPVSSETLLYFSFTTLTTVGFGDVVAVRSLSRMLASMEAITGVLYVAILIARLAGSYGQREARDAAGVPHDV
jgi:hypothetical protein